MLNSAKRVKRAERRNDGEKKKEKYGGPLNRVKKNRASVLLAAEPRACRGDSRGLRTYGYTYIIIYRDEFALKIILN